jgi:signal transduction histidine kinase
MSLLSSLSNRIFLASALLAVLSIAAAVFVVNRTVTGRAEQELEHSLEEAGTLVEQFQSLLFEHLVREARLIADLPKLKAGVSVDHAPTVQPLAQDYRQQIDADLFVVTNRKRQPLGLADSLGLSPAALAEFEGTREASAGRETVAFWPQAKGLLQMVSVPIYLESAQREILGTLSAGVRLDRRLADRIKALTRSEVVFGSGGTIHASTLSDVFRPALEPLLTTPGVSHIVLGDEEFVAVRRLLRLGPAQRGVTPGADGPVMSRGAGEGRGHEPVALILRSRTEHLNFLRTLHSALAGTALLAVLCATLFSFLVARTITRPLGALIATMREMATTGDLTSVPSPPEQESRWEDEDARVLTSTFRTLTQSLRRFQHEASQRERLSSLGRLSTVLAHEIRNPLMIIKASLRTLRRDASHLPDAVAAIADIEEEVGRLNGLVNEVLDYARPIRFDYARVDVNALCRAAAAAATAGQSAPRVAIHEGAGIGEIVTDAERLRLALVNVLTNACDAVNAEPQDAGSAACDPVELHTDSPSPDTIRITIADRGPGIAPEHLSRIFDPFFTTKRTGSGLGLAIAKNIVEGLGGTITIASEPRRGTTVGMTLPRKASIEVGQLSEWAS